MRGRSAALRAPLITLTGPGGPQTLSHSRGLRVVERSRTGWALGCLLSDPDIVPQDGATAWGQEMPAFPRRDAASISVQDTARVLGTSDGAGVRAGRGGALPVLGSLRPDGRKEVAEGEDPMPEGVMHVLHGSSPGSRTGLRKTNARLLNGWSARRKRGRERFLLDTRATEDATGAVACGCLALRGHQGGVQLRGKELERRDASPRGWARALTSGAYV